MVENIKTVDTQFVRWINEFFRKSGSLISISPWAFIITSTIATLLLSLKIPLTEMQNDISDFTPNEARSRKELQIYQNFFSNRGEPKTIYAFCVGKNGHSMLGVPELNETIQVLDTLARDFYLNTTEGPRNFEQYCDGFCSLNDPVRHFYSGMLISEQYGNQSDHLDLGYPVTTVLGTKLYMDPNFFGVKIAVAGDFGAIQLKSVAENDFTIDGEAQVPNNIRELDLVVLQFRAEIGGEASEEDLKTYERSIVDYFQQKDRYSAIDVYILTDSYITSEIVRAGLTLLPFLVIGFTIMSIFSSIVFFVSGTILDQMNFYKIVLAIMACVTPFMACGATFGAMFYLGFRFGSILCVTPFLVLAIGVDDAYLMVNAWQRITSERRRKKYEDVDLEVRHRIQETLVETGPSVAITTITNVLAFGIGSLTPTPEIQLFSIGNALAVTIDFVFQLTIYAALLVLAGRYEVRREMERPASSQATDITEKQVPPELRSEDVSVTNAFSRFLDTYCKLISDKYISSAVLGILAVYWYVSIVGALNIKAELSPEKLFLKNSHIVKLFEQRNQYITPNYSSFWILVGAPGDISDPNSRKNLHKLVEDFEALPGSLGRYSTKFWLRDYEDFLSQGDELDYPEEYEDPENTIEFTQNGSTSIAVETERAGNELKQFLEWPEFAFWNGFIQYEISSDGRVFNLTSFLLTTAFHGEELVDWSNRAKLLNSWRAVADRYPQLNVSIYEEDAKFLDLIETMVPIAVQSAVFTFLSMFLVAFLFIPHPSTLFVATFSILSTSVGVFGMMAWLGADLDPILMSATVMSIGFSVDIPSHISYHYYQTGKDTVAVSERLKKTISAVGLPILQASISTILCVLSLFFVDLHMSHLFAQCMLLVVVIGMVHGLVVVPVIFNIIDTVPRRISYSTRQSTVVAVLPS